MIISPFLILDIGTEVPHDNQFVHFWYPLGGVPPESLTTVPTKSAHLAVCPRLNHFPSQSSALADILLLDGEENKNEKNVAEIINVFTINKIILLFVENFRIRLQTVLLLRIAYVSNFRPV